MPMPFAAIKNVGRNLETDYVFVYAPRIYGAAVSKPLKLLLLYLHGSRLHEVNRSKLLFG